jgi:catechol 2,3-dioxygenase-like lactoylglutathione lyase family enzyme
MLGSSSNTKEDLTMKPARISIVSIPVKDLQRSKAFYVDTLGFVVKRDMPFGETRWVEVGPEHGETRVVLTTWFTHLSPIDGFVIEVDDIEDAYASMQAQGATLTPLETQPWGRFTTLHDPDGNGWVVQQSTPM